MKRTYDVLWFEDQPKLIEPSVDDVRDYCNDLGLELNVTFKVGMRREDVDELSEELNRYNRYDLIVFDFHLGNGVLDGVCTAAVLRNNLFTEMVCYSSSSFEELRGELFDKGVNGVFVASRAGLSDYLSKIVGESIRRSMHIDSFRGFYLSEMSEFDSRVRAAIVEKINGMDADSLKGVLKKYKDLTRDKINDNLETLEGIDDLGSLAQEYRVVEFNTCKRILARLCGKKTEFGKFLNGGELQALQDERNLLAHQSAVYCDGDMVLGDGKVYTQTIFEEKRVRMADLRRMMDRIEKD